MFKFSTRYFILTILLLLTEIFIGFCLHDAFVRPYVGDYLVVMLIYCFVKSFMDTPVIQMAIGVLLFSYVVEISQYFHLVDLIGLGSSRLAVTLMGNYFAWADLFAYTLGIATVILLERIRIKRSIEKVYQEALKD
jgi:DNA integrity scanning protein DisA with diadenylate cyclase activity